MKTTTRSGMAVILILTVVLALMVTMVVSLFKKDKVEIDPHEGQVYIDDGFGMVWMTPYENVPVNDIAREEIVMQGSKPFYTGSAYTTLRGIDVSEHQWGIDWSKVGKADIDFAYVRVGYRGYTEGGIFEDPYFHDNVKGALSNGLKAGVYFFSQAISVEEAIEEANFVLERVRKYNITLPIVFDWEKLDDVPARTFGLDPAVLTECALAFCQTIEEAGYDACVYINRYMGYYGMDISKLTDYDFWLAVPGEYPDFYYKTQIWQYSFTETVPGINEPTDMNLMFIPNVVETPEASSNPQ